MKMTMLMLIADWSRKSALHLGPVAVKSERQKEEGNISTLIDWDFHQVATGVSLLLSTGHFLNLFYLCVLENSHLTCHFLNTICSTFFIPCMHHHVCLSHADISLL